jgi:hypothetical protein
MVKAEDRWIRSLPSLRRLEAQGSPMKMVAEYLEKALNFEQMAASEADPKLKADMLAQAAAYRKLAAERALRDPLSPMPRS